MRFKFWYEKNHRLNTITIISNSFDELKYDINYPDNIIKIKELKPININKQFILKDDKEFLEFFYEMSTMLESKLPIKDVVEILLNTDFSNNIKNILLSIDNALKNGQPIYKALKVHQDYLGYLPILFFKLGERNSNLDQSINSLYKILYENFTIKEKLKKAISYPMILVVSLFISVATIFYFVIPKFQYIFIQLGDSLPFSTYLLLKFKSFLDDNYIFLTVFIVIFWLISTIIYKNYKYYFDKIFILHIPYFSNMYRYMVFYKLFLSISLIVKSKFQFQDAIISTKNISNNLYIKNNLENIIQDINNGMSISRSFEKTSLFDRVAIRLLLTAQKTNKMEKILDDIQKIYKKRLGQNIKIFTTFLEPTLIFIISTIILWLVLAIMTPVWELGNLI